MRRHSFDAGVRADDGPEVSAVISVVSLRNRTAKDLAELARRKKVPGWHDMRKDQLIKALLKAQLSASRSSDKRNGKSNGKPSNSKSHTNGHVNGKSNGKLSLNGKGSGGKAINGRSNGKPAKPVPPRPRQQRKLNQVRERHAAAKDLAFRCVSAEGGAAKDRLVVMVRDPYWLHAYWELSRRTVQRAQAAMGQQWHGAHPVLRLMAVERNGTTTSARKCLRDIPIHGGVNNWYIDVQDPPRSFQLEVGYAAADGTFYSLARSNVVSTPAVTPGTNFDQNWSDVAKDFDRIYAMSGGYEDHESSGELKEVLEERLRRPVGGPLTQRLGIGAAGSGDRKRNFSFEVNTELIVHGTTEPGARVTLRGEPVPLRSDGSFAVRFNLPDRRHVLPVVASSGDGAEQRTIVLAVDRNTKVMEPVTRDAGQ